MPPEVGAVYEYVGKPSAGEHVSRILAIACWTERGRHKAIFVALDNPPDHWWNEVWDLDLVAWSNAWRKRA